MGVYEKDNGKIIIVSSNPSLFRLSMEAEKIDLDKLGWSAERTDKRKLSYVRGYIWRSYKIRIKPPLDFIILCMIMDALQKVKS